MTLHQVGVDYAVAPQGTAMTAEQVKLLGRFAKRGGAHARRRSGGARGDDEGGAPVRRGRAAVPHRAAARAGRQEAGSRRAGAQGSAASCRRSSTTRRTRSSSTSSRWRRPRRRRCRGAWRRSRSARRCSARCAIRWRATSTATSWRSCSRSTRAWCSARCARRRRSSRAPRDVAPAPRRHRRGAGARGGAATDSADPLLAAGLPGAARQTYWPRVDASLLKDEAVRDVGCLGAGAPYASTRHGCSTRCAAEIRDAVAKALGSDEFAGDGDDPDAHLRVDRHRACAYRPICRRS